MRTKLQDWEMELADTYDIPQTMHRESSVKSIMFYFIRDEKNDLNVWLPAENDREEYLLWLKEHPLEK